MINNSITPHIPSDGLNYQRSREEEQPLPLLLNQEEKVNQYTGIKKLKICNGEDYQKLTSILERNLCIIHLEIDFVKDATDNVLKLLFKQRYTLQRLILYGKVGQITDDGLANLSCLAMLKYLKIYGEHCEGITDIGIIYITQLTLLESLFLNSKNITDKSISYFTWLPKLKELYVNGCQITPEGFYTLEKKPNINIEIMQVSDCQINSENQNNFDGIWHILRLPKIKRIEILLNGISYFEFYNYVNNKILPNFPNFNIEPFEERHAAINKMTL